MKINFAQVPAHDVDTFGDDNLIGPDDYGNFYYNAVEFGTNAAGTEEVVIHDTCERMMPIAVDSIPELITALSECYKIAQALKNAETITDYVTIDTNAYITDDGIEYEPIQNIASWPFK